MSAAAARVEDLQTNIASHLRTDGKGARAADGAKAVVEVDLHPRAHHFFGDPLGGLEDMGARVVRRAAREAAQTLTHFVCRWAGFVLSALAGVHAGLAFVRGHLCLFNPGAHLCPAAGYGILCLCLPLPLIPLCGAALGERVARQLCRGLEPTGGPTASPSP